MKILKFLLIALSFLLISCSEGADGEDGENIYITVDTPEEVDTSEPNYVLLSSVAEKGPCNKGASVKAWPLYDNFIQIGPHFEGETKTDLGYWEVPAQITETFTETKFEGLCFNEFNGSTGNQKLGSIFFTSSADRNINSLTTIAVDVIRWVYNNQTIKDKYQAIIDAESLVSDVFGLESMSSFVSISLNDGNLDAAKLAIASAAILKARTDQTDFMVEIAQAIKSGNTTAIESELSTAINALKILEISNNLKVKYESLGQTWVYPPMHLAAGFPDYYEDLLNRTPTTTGSFNLGDNTTGNWDLSYYNEFAIPHVFQSGIEEATHIAINVQADEISIWTRDPSTDTPETIIAIVEQLNEKLLPSTLKTHGIIVDVTGDAYTLESGTDYYFKFRSDNDFVLSTTNEGEGLVFGRKLSRDQSGEDVWVGNTNNTPYWRKSGLVIETFN